MPGALRPRVPGESTLPACLPIWGDVLPWWQKHFTAGCVPRGRCCLRSWVWPFALGQLMGWLCCVLALPSAGWVQEDIAARGGKPWDTVKPLGMHFTDLGAVMLVDDSRECPGGWGLAGGVSWGGGVVECWWGEC